MSQVSSCDSVCDSGCESLVSISETSVEVIRKYARGKKETKKAVREHLQPFFEVMGIKSKEQLAPYRKAIIDVIAKVQLKDTVVQVLGRQKRPGKTKFTEREIYFKSVYGLNEFERCIRTSAQKKMYDEWKYLEALWFDTVSFTLSDINAICHPITKVINNFPRYQRNSWTLQWTASGPRCTRRMMVQIWRAPCWTT